MKVLLVVGMLGLLVVSTIGLSGEGPVWSRYVGSGMVFTLLMLILTGVSNIPSIAEMRGILSGSIPVVTPGATQSAQDDDDDVSGERSAPN